MITKSPYILLFNLNNEQEQAILNWKNCDDYNGYIGEVKASLLHEGILIQNYHETRRGETYADYKLSPIGERLQKSIRYRLSDEHTKEARLRNL